MRGRGAVLVAALVAACVAGSAGPARAQEVDARLSSSRVAVSEPFSLTVAVRGGRVSGEPVFDLPPGLVIVARNRAQSFTWVNGRATNEVRFVYTLVAEAAGRYTFGPIEVRLGDRRFRSGALTVEAAAASIPSEEGGGDAAALMVDVIPREPWVGQATTLRTRLVQRTTFAEDPQYLPPSATGFWSEPPSAPESYYATSGGERVLVTETRARLYPLAAGEATIGEAVAQVVVGGGSGDPFGWPASGARRPLVLRSRPVTVSVRPLPGGAPAAFGGAVGEFVAAWSVDRARTTADVPAQVTLDVRGVGNLPLVRGPELVLDGFDVLAATSEDSAAAPGGPGMARRRFRWTALPRRAGTLRLELPGFAWFDPERGEYRTLAPVAFTLAVEPAPPEPGRRAGPARDGAAGAGGDGRRVRPWVFALAGLALGGAAILFARARAPAAGAAERARALEWLRAVGTAKGPDFWSAAERAGAWLAERGEPVPGLESRVSAARYGGVRPDADESVRRRLVEGLGRAVPAPPPRAALAAAGATLVAVAGVALVLFAAGAPPAGPAALVRAAESAARRGDAVEAADGWRRAWDAGFRSPGLAARLAGVALERGDVAEASAWVLRGRHEEGRDRLLREAESRVREAGGLVGAAFDGLPVRRIEWGLLALAAGLAAGLAARRRRAALGLAGLALLAGLVPAMEGVARRGVREAVVREARLVGDEGLELQPGQAVRILGPAGASDWAIEIARGTRARVPRSSLIEVEPAPAGRAGS